MLSNRVYSNRILTVFSMLPKYVFILNDHHRLPLTSLRVLNIARASEPQADFGTLSVPTKWRDPVRVDVRAAIVRHYGSHQTALLTNSGPCYTKRWVGRLSLDRPANGAVPNQKIVRND